jgi:short-subunit dehydrogenase
MRDFVNKNVYITGGSSGIGLSTASMLAGAGANVIIFARTREKLEIALKQIEQQRVSPAQRFAFQRLDVADHGMVNEVMSAAVKDFGVPDLLINCAGRAYPRYFEDIGYAQFDDTLKTNLYSIWSTVSVLVPFMKQKGGTIVNVSSIAGFVGVFGYTDYSASKFGIIGLSEALKQELRQYGISVAVLCPPDTETPGFATENLTKPEETKAISKSAKVMQPDEVAKALIAGIRKDTFMIIPGFDGKLTHVMKGLFPSVVDLVMEGTIRKVQKGK